MTLISAAATQVEAEARFSLGEVRLAHEWWDRPIDTTTVPTKHLLKLSLLPVKDGGNGCFPDDWGPHRFEPFGQMFLMPAEHRVHARSVCRQLHSLSCFFDPDAVSKWFEGDLQWTAGRLRGSLNIVNANIRRLLIQMGDELRTPSFAGEALLELLAAQLAIELSRHLMGIEANRTFGGLSIRQSRNIDARLADIVAPPPSLAELAELCNISVRHLSRSFRVSHDRSIGSYISERCMENAKQLLASGMSLKSGCRIFAPLRMANFRGAHSLLITPGCFPRGAQKGG